MKSDALVSVVCLCYNHERFVEEAIRSVLNQTYKNIQLIVVDDCSTDKSVEIIQKLVDQHSQITFLSLKENIGNCAAFNKGLELVKGEFVIDFAADDVMLSDRIEKQIQIFSQLDSKYGVVFTDSIYIDIDGKPFRNHTEYLLNKKIIRSIPQGDVFREVLCSFFISPPTMMVHKKVFDELKGYDENLAYEDFDFWVRSSRIFNYAYLDERLTLVRKVPGSKSFNQYLKGDKQLHSTYLVCQKAEKLCRDEEDKIALRWRVLYEFRHAVFSGNKTESKLFAELLKSLGKIPIQFYTIKLISFFPLPWRWIRKMYYQLE